MPSFNPTFLLPPSLPASIALPACGVDWTDVFGRTDTAGQTTGIGAGKAANIKNCELCARKIAEVADTPKVVVEKSTVPVRTAEAVRRVLATNDRGVKFQVRARSASSELRAWQRKYDAMVYGMLFP